MENWNYCRCGRFNHHADFMMWLYNKVMNWVSRHILLAPFMCLFLLFACGSSHKAVKSNTEIIMKDSTRESVNIVHGSSISLSELITTNGNYVIDFRFHRMTCNIAPAIRIIVFLKIYHIFRIYSLVV